MNNHKWLRYPGGKIHWVDRDRGWAICGIGAPLDHWIVGVWVLAKKGEKIKICKTCLREYRNGGE